MNETQCNELVVFIIRETGWTLEYVQDLPIETLNALVEELRYQKAMDEYKQAYNAALIASILANQRSRRRYQPTDLIGQPPERKEVDKGDKLSKLARKQGIKMPTKKKEGEDGKSKED